MGHVTRGNVFEDLGFNREEAIDLAMKVDLALELRKFIDRQNLKPHEKAAEFFNRPRPKITNIVNNKLDGISIDYLVRMLAKTGGRFTYKFRQPSRQTVKKRVKEQQTQTAA